MYFFKNVFVKQNCKSRDELLGGDDGTVENVPVFLILTSCSHWPLHLDPQVHHHAS